MEFQNAVMKWNITEDGRAYLTLPVAIMGQVMWVTVGFESPEFFKFFMMTFDAAQAMINAGSRRTDIPKQILDAFKDVDNGGYMLPEV